MILRTENTYPETIGTAHSPDSSQPPTPHARQFTVTAGPGPGSGSAARYEISALSGLLASARASISVAVLGRYKAGKSSFLNHFIGQHP